jgi:hypothetical protein
MAFSQKESAKPLKVNPRLERAEYAVRGELALRAEELIQQKQDNPNSLPFDKVINCNIGNPQQLGQRPLTFLTQVLSLLEVSLEMFDAIKQHYPKDVIRRVCQIKESISSLGINKLSINVSH